MQKLNIQSWISAKHKEKTKENFIILEEKLKTTPVEVSARMGSTKIKLSELMRLEKGDVLMFDKRADEKFKILLAFYLYNYAI